MIRRRRTKRIPKSLSSSQIGVRVLIAGVVIFLLVFIAILINHWYLYTHSKRPAEIVSSVHPPSQPQPKSELAPAPSESSVESKPDTPLTFYDSLVQKETPDLTPSSASPEPIATPLETVSKEGRDVREDIGYTVQVGSFQSLEYAEGIVEALKKKGYSPSLATVSLPNGKTWHRVRIGNCNSREEAEILAQKLKEGDNFEPMIIAPQKGK